MTLCLKILCDVIVKKAPHHLKNAHLLKAYQTEKPENVPTLIVLDNLMDSASSTKVSELFTKRSHLRYLSLILIHKTCSTKGHHRVVLL